MPTYCFLNEKTKEEKTLFMSISEMLEFEKDNPEWKVQIAKTGAPSIGYSYGGLKGKVPKAFNERLRKIKNMHGASHIDIHE